MTPRSTSPSRKEEGKGARQGRHPTAINQHGTASGEKTALPLPASPRSAGSGRLPGSVRSFPAAAAAVFDPASRRSPSVSDATHSARAVTASEEFGENSEESGEKSEGRRGRGKKRRSTEEDWDRGRGERGEEEEEESEEEEEEYGQEDEEREEEEEQSGKRRRRRKREEEDGGHKRRKRREKEEGGQQRRKKEEEREEEEGGQTRRKRRQKRREDSRGRREERGEEGGERTEEEKEEREDSRGGRGGRTEKEDEESGPQRRKRREREVREDLELRQRAPGFLSLLVPACAAERQRERGESKRSQPVCLHGHRAQRCLGGLERERGRHQLRCEFKRKQAKARRKQY
eukprot:591675-Rhodomonas_salina.2